MRICLSFASAFRGDTTLAGSDIWMTENGLAVETTSPADAAIFVARGGKLAASIIVADTMREEAPQAIEALHRMGMRTVLRTGDTHALATADAASRQIGSGLLLRDIFAIATHLQISPYSLNARFLWTFPGDQRAN